MDRWTRTPAAVLAIAALAVALSGCVRISGTSSSQPQSMGPVTLSVSACANGSTNCDGATNTSSLFDFLEATMSDTVFQAQMLFAVRLPEGSTPPDALTGQISGGGALNFSRSASYEAELQAFEPAPAGERWWGWLSSQVAYSRHTAQSWSVSFVTTLPTAAGGGPLPSPMRWRPVVGTRQVDPVGPPPLPATRPVDCGVDAEDLYDGYNEPTPISSTPTVVCVDSPTPDATRGFLEAPITDFGVTGTTVTAPAGSTVTATFLAQRSGAADAATTFALAAAGGPPGGSVSLDRTSVSLAEAATPVLATVGIPAGTPPGSYPVTVTATSAGKPTRSGTTTVTVPAPPAPPPPPAGPAADTTAPAFRSASLTRRRFRAGPRATPLTAQRRTPAGTTLRVNLSEAATLSVVVERLRPGRRVGRRCSTRARTGRRCTVAKRAGTLTRRLGSGASSVPFSGRIGRRKLAAGKYRLRLVATDAAGNRSAARTLPFTLVAR